MPNPVEQSFPIEAFHKNSKKTDVGCSAKEQRSDQVKKTIQHLGFRAAWLITPHPSLSRATVCLPLPKDVGDRKFSFLLTSHKLYLCLGESGVYSPQ